MNKEELKNIVAEIFGNSSETVFNQFIEIIASTIKGNQALLLNSIGHFQIKKEPLSRMERKEEGSIGDKEILLFLPAGEIGDENIMLIEFDEKRKTSTGFSDSVFDLGINQPNIISPESEISEEEGAITDDSLQNNITEFIGSGEIIEGYQLFDGNESHPLSNDDEEIDSEEKITDDNLSDFTNDTESESEELITEDNLSMGNFSDFTEVEKNTEFTHDTE